MAEKKVKVRVLNATVDGKGPGEIISVTEKAADHLESIRYVARIGSPAADEFKEQEEKGDE